MPDEIKEIIDLMTNQQANGELSFWDLLMMFNGDTQGNKRAQAFLLDVFYASITDETRNIFVNEDYTRTLIYVDMPFIPVADTEKSVDEINKATEVFSGQRGDSAEKLTGVAATAIDKPEDCIIAVDIAYFRSSTYNNRSRNCIQRYDLFGLNYVPCYRNCWFAMVGHV